MLPNEPPRSPCCCCSLGFSMQLPSFHVKPLAGIWRGLCGEFGFTSPCRHAVAAAGCRLLRSSCFDWAVAGHFARAAAASAPVPTGLRCVGGEVQQQQQQQGTQSWLTGWLAAWPKITHHASAGRARRGSKQSTPPPRSGIHASTLCWHLARVNRRIYNTTLSFGASYLPLLASDVCAGPVSYQ